MTVVVLDLTFAVSIAGFFLVSIAYLVACDKLK